MIGGENSLGIYISVPFCRAKCSFCNFASGVFGAERWDGYLGRLLDEMRGVRAFASGLGVLMPEVVDTIYFGGGTPSLMAAEVTERVFAGLRGAFAVAPDAEITVECAPGQLSDESLEAFLRAGVNRLSFGVQSFVDAESTAVGRSHTGASCRAELARVMAAGVKRVGVDLICGLPGQTEDSWRYSVEQTLESGVEHVSVYMLEVDENSRLGREKLAGGMRYGAGVLPEDDRVADWYGMGCEWLAAGGVGQYEISNFARGGGRSRHNVKYWERAPYLGFGMDAHSMLRCGMEGVRWSNTGEMGGYVGLLGEKGFAREVERVGVESAFEETVFLGLRMVDGVDNVELQRVFGRGVEVGELVEAGLVVFEGDRVKLTGRGREVSNEVFERVLVGSEGVCGGTGATAAAT